MTTSQRLEAAARDALRRLSTHPAEAVADLIQMLASELVPEVRARLRSAGADLAAAGLDLQVSEIANVLSIVGSSRGFERRLPGEVKLARAQIEKLLELVPQVRSLDELPDDPAAEGRARAELYFVAPPDRSATEAYVLRHNPRPPKVWSPAPPDRSRARSISAGADVAREAEGRPVEQNQDVTISQAPTARRPARPIPSTGTTPAHT